jgi:hypothetical protein
MFKRYFKKRSRRIYPHLNETWRFLIFPCMFYNDNYYIMMDILIFLYS